MRAIIVDDELPAREYLRLLLERIGGVDVVGEAHEAGECLRLVALNRPNVVFLDIRLPGMSGVSVAEILLKMESPPQVVFTTGYDEYAVKAFDLSAADYLLKPFDEDRLRKTVERLNSRQDDGNSRQPDTKALMDVLSSNKLPVKSEDGWILVPTANILYAKTEARKVRIQTRQGGYLSHYTIGELERRLRVFFRANEGCLVNLDYVKEVVSYGSRTYELLLNDGKETYIPLSRSKAQKLREMLKL